MRTEHTGFANSAPARASAPRRVEKPSAANRLGREEQGDAKATTTNSTARETVAPSRFETRTRCSDFEMLPVSGFAAQIIGQMLSPERNAPVQAALAYGRAKAGSRYQRPLKYA